MNRLFAHCRRVLACPKTCVYIYIQRYHYKAYIYTCIVLLGHGGQDDLTPYFVHCLEIFIQLAESKKGSRANHLTSDANVSPYGSTLEHPSHQANPRKVFTTGHADLAIPRSSWIVFPAPPRTNGISSENQWLVQMKSPFEMVPFWGGTFVHFRGGIYMDHDIFITLAQGLCPSAGATSLQNLVTGPLLLHELPNDPTYRVRHRWNFANVEDLQGETDSFQMSEKIHVQTARIVSILPLSPFARIRQLRSLLGRQCHIINLIS